MNLIFPRLIATLSNTFKINKANLDASNVSVNTNIVIPNKPGTIALTNDLPLYSVQLPIYKQVTGSFPTLVGSFILPPKTYSTITVFFGCVDITHIPKFELSSPQGYSYKVLSDTAHGLMSITSTFNHVINSNTEVEISLNGNYSTSVTILEGIFIQ